MHPDSRPPRPWRAALLALVISVAALGLVAAISQGVGLRGEVGRTGDPLASSADALAARLDPARTARAREQLRGTGEAARLVGPAGAVRIQTGPDLWRAGDAGWAARLATAGAGAWTLRSGAVEAAATLPSGGRVVLRAPLPPGAGSLGTGGRPLLGAIVLLSLLAAVLTWILAARRGARLRRFAAAAEAAAAGRPAAVPVEGRGDWRRASEAAHAVSVRVADLQDAAEARVEALGAALAPLAHPAAARTPAGGLIRNDALERLVGGMPAGDAAQVEAAVRVGLSSSGPVSQRVTLSDARALDVEAWGVPGGRIVAVGDRTEQARLAALRRQVTGSAARHLQAPVGEVRALASELMTQVPASAASTARRIVSASDRLERVVAQMLRGTANDPRARPLRVGDVSIAGIAFALGRAVDRRLKDRGLQLETDIPADLPAVRTDAALVHEILSELVANSATFTPRGGRITIAGRLLPGGDVEVTVRDTGPGIAPEELPLAGERFGRGAGAMGFPGAGLGLGVAGALAERLGGRLAIDPGPGGRARLQLPAAPAAAPPDPGGADAEPLVTAGSGASP